MSVKQKYMRLLYIYILNKNLSLFENLNNHIHNKHNYYKFSMSRTIIIMNFIFIKSLVFNYKCPFKKE